MNRKSYSFIGLLLGIVVMSSFIGALWFIPTETPLEPVEERPEIINGIFSYPEEENETMKYEQFASVASTNDDLEDLQSFHNIGYKTDPWFLVQEKISLPSDTIYLRFKSSDGLTGSTTTEYSYSKDVGTVLSPMLGVALFISEDGEDIYGTQMYAYEDGGNYLTVINIRYSNDGGDNWSNREKTVSTTGTSYDTFVTRTFDIAGTYYQLYFVYDGVDRKAEFINIGTGAVVSVNMFNDRMAIYGGNTYDSLYRFIYKDTSGDLILASFNGTTISTIETLSITAPSTFNAQVQQYWNFGLLEIIMDEDHFYLRLDGGAWGELSDTGSTTNAVIWGFDADGRYIPKYFIWKDSILKVVSDKGLVKIQETTANAYVGWNDWFCNGADTIYQVDLIDFPYIYETAPERAYRALYKANYFELICQTEPFDEQFVILYNDAEELLIQDFVTDYQSTSDEFKWKVGNHPDLFDPAGAVFQDLDADVEVSYTAKTIHYILKDILDTYCTFLYYDTGISTTPADTYTISFSKKVVDVFRWADTLSGYQVSWRPNFEVYWDLYTVHSWDYKLAPSTVQVGTNLDEDLSAFTLACDTSEIVAEYQGHKNTYHIVEATGTSKQDYLDFTATITGTIEFNAREIASGGESRIHISDGANVRIWIRCHETYIRFGHGDGAGGMTYYNHNFTTDFPHVKITFDCATDTFSAYCEDTEIFTDENFYLDRTSTTLSRIYFGGYDTSHATDLYIDAIHFSWDGGSAGDNQEQIAEWVMTAQPEIKPMKQRFGQYYITGGYLNGVQLTSSSIKNPNWAKYIDEFPEITNQTDLDTMRVKLETTKNLSINKINLQIIGAGWVNPGQEITVTSSQFSLDKETFYIIESHYDEMTDECSLVGTDAIWQPPIKTTQTTTNNNTNQKISNLETKTTWTWRNSLSAYDFDETDLTATTGFQYLDLSSIVGSKEVELDLRVTLLDNVVGSVFTVRNGTDTTGYIIDREFILTAGGSYQEHCYRCRTDSSGRIYVACNPVPASWTGIDILVRGYRGI